MLLRYWLYKGKVPPCLNHMSCKPLSIWVEKNLRSPFRNKQRLWFHQKKGSMMVPAHMPNQAVIFKDINPFRGILHSLQFADGKETLKLKPVPPC